MSEGVPRGTSGKILGRFSETNSAKISIPIFRGIAKKLKESLLEFMKETLEDSLNNFLEEPQYEFLKGN